MSTTLQLAKLDALKGHGFSRAVSGTETTSALAAEECFWETSSETMLLPQSQMPPR
jgi:hypothetical protein